MKILLLIGGLIGLTLPAYANDPYVIGENLVLKSEILGEDRPYIVHLPASYSDTTYQQRNYPVLYILDGSKHFLPAVGVINHMSNPLNNANLRIPELIVVAIKNTKDRTLDLTPTSSSYSPVENSTKQPPMGGGSVKFLQFIEKELIPEIETKYRVLPHRTFVGHSFGGLTVLHSLLIQPGLFNNYIATDPSLWWDDKIMLKWVQKFILENKEKKARIFMSSADHEASDSFSSFINMTASNKFFYERLQKSQSGDLNVKFQIFPGQDHGSVPLLGIYYGLIHGFNGYKLEMETILAGVEVFSKHFKDYSEREGVKFLPTEHLVDMITTYMGNELSPDVVKDYLELNVRNYPDSVHAKAKLDEFLEKEK
ncbi:MAG: alpha/beta hydrolase-fold protein [Pseudomonadota bacterium]